MDWKRFFSGTGASSPKSPSWAGLPELLLEELRAELAAARRREEELLRQLAEAQAQIRLVLEDRFYRPVVTGPAGRDPAGRDPLFAPEQLQDMPGFDEEEDAKQIRRELAGS